MRNVRKTVRFTEEEMRFVESEAEKRGLTVSEYIRMAALKKRPLGFYEQLVRSEEFRKFLYELNRIGVNINQIARYCNTFKEVDAMVLQELISIEERLEEVIRNFLPSRSGGKDAHRQTGRFTSTREGEVSHGEGKGRGY